MATIINGIRVDFGLGAIPPTVTFLQGADMNIPGIRDTLRQLEQSEEGRMHPGAISKKGTAQGWIVEAGGNFEFSDVESSALSIEILSPFKMSFEPGPIAFQTNTGSLLGTFNESPGAVVQVNNAVGSTNIQSELIEFSSYGGVITIDTTNVSGISISGTEFPAGTPKAPVDNLTDLHLISLATGIVKVSVLGNLQITNTANWDRYQFEGESVTKSIITVDSDASVVNCEFYECTLMGTLDGNSHIERSIVSGLNYVDGYIFNCAVGPTVIQLGTSTTANMFSCYSTVPGTTTPIIDMNATGVLALRNYNGGILLKNYSGVGSHSIDLISGQIKLENTITSGTFIVRGVGKLVETDGTPIVTGTWNGGVTIVNELLTAGAISGGGGGATAQEVWEYPISTLSGDKTTMGYWVTRKLLSVARYLGLKKHD